MLSIFFDLIDAQSGARGMACSLLPLQTGHKNPLQYLDELGPNTEAHQKQESHIKK
jgi:hypothetical protein